jgi:hypothetical protein
MPLPLLPLLAATAIGTVATLVFQRPRRRMQHATFVQAMRAGLLLDQLREGTSKPVESLSDGEVARLSGPCEPSGDVLEAPLSGRKCVAWEISVWTPIGGKSWRVAQRASAAVPFDVVDATGRASIDVERARSYAAVDREEYVAAWSHLPAAVRARLAREGIEASGMLHVKESVLEPGEEVAVVGLVARSSGSYRDSATLSVRLSAPPGGMLLFSDAPEAIDPDAV